MRYGTTPKVMLAWARRNGSDPARLVACWAAAAAGLVVLCALVLPLVYAGRAVAAPSRTLQAWRQSPVQVARRELKGAERALARSVKNADRAAADAQKAYDQRVAAARAQLEALQSNTGARRGSYRGITLHERWISTPQGQGNVIGAQASVDTAGNMALNKRPTLTRMAAGGLMLGPVGALGSLAFQKKKVEDKRELYLMVQTSSFAAVVTCPADDGPKARQFAAAITTQGIAAANAEAGRPAAIARAAAELARVQGDVGALEAAKSRAVSVRDDPALHAAIGGARARLDAAVAEYKRDDDETGVAAIELGPRATRTDPALEP